MDSDTSDKPWPMNSELADHLLYILAMDGLLVSREMMIDRFWTCRKLAKFYLGMQIYMTGLKSDIILVLPVSKIGTLYDDGRWACKVLILYKVKIYELSLVITSDLMSVVDSLSLWLEEKYIVLSSPATQQRMMTTGFLCRAKDSILFRLVEIYH